jgi:hypothetical protein
MLHVFQGSYKNILLYDANRVKSDYEAMYWYAFIIL